MTTQQRSLPAEAREPVLAAAIALHIAYDRSPEGLLGRDADAGFDGALAFAVKAWHKVYESQDPRP